MKKGLKIVKKVVNILIGIFVFMFLLVVCLQRFSNNRLSFFNYRMFTVLTGSMEPKYNVGDVLISKDVPIDELKVGDAISYIGKTGDVKDKVVTHEIVEIEITSEGKKIFHTQGIANIIEDPLVYEDQIYGKIVSKSNILSFISKSIRTPLGLVLIIIIPAFYIIGSEMLSMLLHKEERRRSRE